MNIDTTSITKVIYRWPKLEWVVPTIVIYVIDDFVRLHVQETNLSFCDSIALETESIFAIIRR